MKAKPPAIHPWSQSLISVLPSPTSLRQCGCGRQGYGTIRSRKMIHPSHSESHLTGALRRSISLTETDSAPPTWSFSPTPSYLAISRHMSMQHPSILQYTPNSSRSTLPHDTLLTSTPREFDSLSPGTFVESPIRNVVLTARTTLCPTGSSPPVHIPFLYSVIPTSQIFAFVVNRQDHQINLGRRTGRFHPHPHLSVTSGAT